MTRGYACDVCGGRGWVRRGGAAAWPECCRLCNGRGSFSRYRLGKILRESPRTLRRVERGVSKPVTAVRVFDKVAGFLEAWAWAIP